jgi:hypothetical protein
MMKAEASGIVSDDTWMGINIIVEPTLPEGTILLVKDKDNWVKVINVGV